THGEVAARSASDPPDWAARDVAICMPCLSITCPVAAVATAKSSSPMLAMVKWRLPGLSSGRSASCAGLPAGRVSRRSGASASGDFDIRRSPSAWSATRPASTRARRSPMRAVGTSRFPDLGGRLGRGAGRRDLGRGQEGIDVEVGVLAKPVLAQPVLPARLQHAETVLDAAAQVDRRRLGLVAGRARHLADPGARRNGLRDDLVVEAEIIG